MDRYFYNGAEHLRFDSDLGEFQAMKERGRPIFKSLKSRKDLLEKQRSAVNIYCKHNYQGTAILIKLQIVKPLVTVFPAKTQTLNHHNLLVCSVNGFYPGHIEVRWFRNGQEQEAGVIATGLIPNGDWTFQTLVMLETVPESGDIYV
ncbi:HLA class II histocompatibility antigen, DR beta 3 chain-like [Suncus etruscus]|uniref:HLA class II histocompatibility antigen, DR beta 3 chain-like n=1 Tax=Suncus etruscus TaxID=109475 RepID=UPI00210F5D25|nr:HLA class II histocompatibility antigen, DR beta 3 chain-like [Suncus etruscus]